MQALKYEIRLNLKLLSLSNQQQSKGGANGSVAPFLVKKFTDKNSFFQGKKYLIIGKHHF